MTPEEVIANSKNFPQVDWTHDDIRVLKLLRSWGWTEHKMAQAFGVSFSQIHYQMRKIREKENA